MLVIPTFVPVVLTVCSDQFCHGHSHWAPTHLPSESGDMGLSPAPPFLTYLFIHSATSCQIHPSQCCTQLRPPSSNPTAGHHGLTTVSKSPRSSQYEGEVVSNLVTSAMELPDAHMHNHNCNEAKQQLTLCNSSRKFICMHSIRSQTAPSSTGSPSHWPPLRSKAELILNTLNLDCKSFPSTASAEMPMKCLSNFMYTALSSPLLPLDFWVGLES